jgi:hypothetical protein
MKHFTVITPTGDRPETFALCERYLYRQTLKPSKWIVVDDGIKYTTMGGGFKDVVYIKRQASIEPEKHTLPLQMMEALKRVDTLRE